MTLSVNTPDGTTSVKYDLILWSSLEWKISEFFRAIGQKKHGEKFVPRWREVVGSQGRGHFKPDLKEFVSQDDACSASALKSIIQSNTTKWMFEAAQSQAEAARDAVKTVTAWRVDGTLREFPKFQPVNLWFRYPVHIVDDSGILGDVEPDSDEPYWKKGSRKSRENAEVKRRNKAEEFADAVENCCAGEPPTVKDLVEWYTNSGRNVSERTIRDWVKKFGFCLDRNSGKVLRCDTASEIS